MSLTCRNLSFNSITSEGTFVAFTKISNSDADRIRIFVNIDLRSLKQKQNENVVEEQRKAQKTSMKAVSKSNHKLFSPNT